MALHYRYGEAVFHRNAFGGPGEAKTYPQIGRRFRRIEAAIRQDVSFPFGGRNGTPVNYTLQGSATTAYNRYDGHRVDEFGGDFTSYETLGRSVQDPAPPANWGFLFQEQTAHGISVGDTSVSETRTNRYQSFGESGFITTRLDHYFLDEATQDQAIEDVGRLLDFLDLDTLPWGFPDPATNPVPNHLWSAVHYAGFLDGNGGIGLSTPSGATGDGTTIPGRGRYFNRPLTLPDEGASGLIPDLWAGVCFNPYDDFTTQALFQHGTVSAVKALVVASQGPFVGVITRGGIGQSLGGDTCAPIEETERPLFIGATPADLVRYPERAHVHDWEDLVALPGFLQVSRQPC